MKIETTDKLWLRKSMSGGEWLSRCPVAFQDALIEHSVLTTHETGDVILSIGDPAGVTGFVTGSGVLTMTFENRPPQRAHIVHAGSWFGAASIMGRTKRIVGVVAAENCSVLTLSLDASERMLIENNNYWRWFGLLAAQNQRISIRATEALMQRDPAIKLAATLLRLLGTANNGNNIVELAISQADLAEMSNLSRGFVSTCLTDLQAKGVVEKRYGRIAVLDPAQLTASIANY